MKKMCEICGSSPATVPDRNKPGRLINRVCSYCHAERLKSDARRIIEFQENLKRDFPDLGAAQGEKA